MTRWQTRREALTALLAGAASAAWYSSAQADEITTLRIGMVQGLFRDVQPALVQAMAMPLRTIMNRQTGLDGKIEVLPDPFTQAQKLLSEEIQLGVFHGFEYAWVAERHPELQALLVAVPASGKVGATVVVRQESEYQSLADLTGDPIVVPRGARAHSLLFLERQRAKLERTIARSKTVLAMTAEDALDSVVLGDTPAVLVDTAALNGYATLQPGAVKQLRQLAVSSQFPPGAIVIKKGAIPAEMLTRIKTGLQTAHKNTAGKSLIALWNLRGFEEIPEGYEELVQAIRKEYPAPQPPERK